MTKEIALKMIDDFAARQGGGRFTKLSREKIANGLRARVQTPSMINQASGGVCGPASVVYSLALNRPVDYVAAVTGLFDFGAATIKTWQLKPDRELLDKPCPPPNPKYPPFEEVDWIILASIRDSENWFFDYHTDEDTSDGTSDWELKRWMEKAGFTDIQSDNGGYFYTTMADKERMLQKVLELQKKDYRVIIAINASIMDSVLQTSPKLAGADHVVVIRDTFVIPADRNDPIRIPVFTWGRKTTIPEAGGLKYGQFLEHFASYVAGKG